MTTWQEGIDRSIANAGSDTPTSLEDGYNILRIRIDERAAQDFTFTVRKLMTVNGYSEADAIAAYWWAYA